jgi:hypothetical protein
VDLSASDLKIGFPLRTAEDKPKLASNEGWMAHVWQRLNVRRPTQLRDIEVG